MDYFSASRSVSPVESFPELTQREREILARIARGESNKVIAGQLGISLKTVRSRVSNIYSKLQVVDRAQAVLRARDQRPAQQQTSIEIAARAFGCDPSTCPLPKALRGYRTPARMS